MSPARRMKRSVAQRRLTAADHSMATSVELRQFTTESSKWGANRRVSSLLPARQLIVAWWRALLGHYFPEETISRGSTRVGALRGGIAGGAENQLHTGTVLMGGPGMT